MTLKNGHIQYEIHYRYLKPLVLRSSQKYNNGLKVKISAEKVWLRDKRQDIVILNVANETNITDIRTSVDGSAILRLKKVNYYFGGVPSDYFLQSNRVTDALHTHQSLLGGLQDIKEYQLFSLHETNGFQRKYGVEEHSGEVSRKMSMQQ